jgi:hypothetical protein
VTLALSNRGYEWERKVVEKILAGKWRGGWEWLIPCVFLFCLIIYNLLFNSSEFAKNSIPMSAFRSCENSTTKQSIRTVTDEVLWQWSPSTCGMDEAQSLVTRPFLG